MRIVVGATAAATLALTTLTFAPAAQAAQSGGAYDWTSVNVDTTQGFRALDAIDAKTAWVGGDGGGVFRTTDGGRTWDEVSPPGSDGLLFRDVEARSASEAVALSIGEGEASRIYKTVDGGATWTETFRSAEPTAFYNCVDFWPGGKRGIAMSDPVDGEWRIITTSDGGDTWTIADTRGLEAPGEFGYSASGTCLVTAGARDAWIGGRTAIAVGPNGSDISHDNGRSWKPFGATQTRFHTVDCAQGACWAAGAGGRVGVLTR